MNALKLLEEAKNSRVLFCGERIIDVYRYCTPLGRPTKDAIVSVQSVSTETFQGGICAAVNHANDFCSAYMCEMGNVVRKTRFVEHSHARKLFEFYEDVPASVTRPPPFAMYDQVVVIDYGHGMADHEFFARVASDSNDCSIGPSRFCVASRASDSSTQR